MRLIITDTYSQSAQLAAEQILSVVRNKPACLLGLATGSTPIPIYEHMVRAHKEGAADFSRVSTINLDEYMGVCGDNPNSYLYFMRKHLLDPCDIPLARVCIPNGESPIKEELGRLNAYANGHAIDIQLLGIGVNGHIGFNEPNDVFCDLFHDVELTAKTRESNARMFRSLEEVPTRAITMGIGGIMRAGAIVIAATGEEKYAAMKALLEDGDITPDNQATILKLHRDCTIYLDRALAGRINPAGYVQVINA